MSNEDEFLPDDNVDSLPFWESHALRRTGATSRAKLPTHSDGIIEARRQRGRVVMATSRSARHRQGGLIEPYITSESRLPN